MRHRLILFATVASGLLGLAAAINVVVDPYHLYGSPLRNGINMANPDIGSHSNFVKAAEIIRFRPERILLGSSVVDGAFDVNRVFSEPTVKAYLSATLRADEAKNGLIYNAGIRGGGLYEAYEYLRHAYANNPKLKHVILGVEHNLFTEMKPPLPTDHETPLAGQTFFPPDIVFAHTLSWSALDYSFKLLALNNRHELDEIEAQAWFHIGRIWRFLRATAHAAMPDTARPGLSPVANSVIGEHPVLARTVPEGRALVFSAAVAKDLTKRVAARGDDVANRPDAFEMMRKIVAFAHEHDIKLDVYASPNHWLYWATFQRFGLYRHAEEWWRRLAAITPYWDFARDIEYAPRADEFFEGEPLHFNPLAGQLILGAILSADSPERRGFAFRVEAANVESWLLRKREMMTRHLAANPYVAAVLEATTMDRIAGGWDQQAPYALASDYRGYRLVHALGRFYAAPAAEAPFDLRALVTGACGPLFEGKTVAETVDAIDAASSAAGARSGKICHSPVDPKVSRPTYASVNREAPPQGTAISSGIWLAPPDAAFDGQPQTFWVSKQLGKDIKGTSWVGLAFDRPREVGSITVLQDVSYPFRQDYVRIQQSRDGGSSWRDVIDNPVLLDADRNVVALPPAPEATHWRLLAEGENATTQGHAWKVFEVQFLARGETELSAPWLRTSGAAP